jgi:hypothetical protein
VNEEYKVGKRKLWVTSGYTVIVLGLCGWLLHAEKISGSEFLQAVSITGLLVGAYLGANVAKGVWGK